MLEIILGVSILWIAELLQTKVSAPEESMQNPFGIISPYLISIVTLIISLASLSALVLKNKR